MWRDLCLVLRGIGTLFVPTEKAGHMHVRELMRTDVVSCGPEEPLDIAARAMWEQDIGVLPVVDREQRVVGMITDRDICMAAYTTGRELRALRVAGAMSKQVVSCAPGDSIGLAAERMRRHQVRRLPVVSDGRLVGILSLNDYANAAIYGDPKRGSLRLDDVAKTLARISEHRSSATEYAIAAE